MSGEFEKMTDEEIAKWQEELYELERDCSTGSPMTEEEKMRRIDEVLSGNFRKIFRAKIEARKKELAQEIALNQTPKRRNGYSGT